MYIAEIEKIMPQKYSCEFVADKMYPVELYGNKLNRLAKKLSHKFGISQRASVLDYEQYPKIKLVSENEHPINWGKRIIDKLTTNITKDEIGLFSLGYNISFHSDILPNLASQIVMKSKLNNLDVNEEIPYYGCAASIYSLKNAVDYCAKYERPAIVFIFDQCTCSSLQLNQDDEDFNSMLLTNLLFTDGGVGLLVIPEKMRSNYNKPLIKITDIKTKYTPGDLIKMKDSKFLMSSNVKNIMPKLVSNKIVKPFLNENNIDINHINEWSIHQGGSEVIKKFCQEECLNLSDEKIKRSLDKFYDYGNTSAASCLLVLESFFNDTNNLKDSTTTGIVLGFGAGYYLGVALYSWDI